MSKMTVEIAKSLMKVIHVKSHRVSSSSYHISQSHQIVDDCNHDTKTDHNTDG